MNINLSFNNYHNLNFQGLLSHCELESIESSGDFHYSKIAKYYCPFADEDKEGIDKFVKSNSKFKAGESIGEINYEQIIIHPLEKLGFTTKEYLAYKSKLLYNLTPEKIDKIEMELKLRGLHKYLNVEKSPVINSYCKKLLNFIKDILL